MKLGCFEEICKETCSKIWTDDNNSEKCYHFCQNKIDKNISDTNMEAYEIMREFINKKIGLVIENKTLLFENGTTMQPEYNETDKNETQFSKISCEKNKTEIEEIYSKHNQSINENQAGGQKLEEKISDLEKNIQNQKGKLLFLEDQMLRLQKQKTMEIKEFFKKIKK